MDLVHHKTVDVLQEWKTTRGRQHSTTPTLPFTLPCKMPRGTEALRARAKNATHSKQDFTYNQSIDTVISLLNSQLLLYHSIKCRHFNTASPTMKRLRVPAAARGASESFHTGEFFPSTLESTQPFPIFSLSEPSKEEDATES